MTTSHKIGDPCTQSADCAPSASPLVCITGTCTDASVPVYSCSTVSGTVGSCIATDPTTCGYIDGKTQPSNAGHTVCFTSQASCAQLCGGKTCPNNCSSNGVCNSVMGTCSCYGGYNGSDCSVAPLVPLTPAFDMLPYIITGGVLLSLLFLLFIYRRNRY